MATPLCPYFGSCGGCATQHLEYSLQLENKKKSLTQLINYSDINVFSANEYFYRNRMDFVFHPRGVGLREKDKWWKIMDIERCVISQEPLNKLLLEVRTFFTNVDAFDVRQHTGTFRYAVIRVTTIGDSSVSFVVNEESTKLEEATEKIKEFAAKTTANNILITYVKPDTDESVSEEYILIKGRELLQEKLLGRTFYYPVQGFFQNNPAMAEKMLQYSYDILPKYDTKKAHLLDLYGGVGTFGIINSDLFKAVTIVESVPPAIECAKRNAKENRISNSNALVLDARNLKKLALPSPLFVITDPPRSGMHPKTIEELKRVKPEVILYISCNIQQLAKDIPKFKEYKIQSAALFDLFPQTNHVEAAVELVKTL
ncbi:23S rRNA (uracil(1939)-C(5))-methyltransferase RlmD [Candidatus Woesearchaeota archaeon]|nr:23S rRNA (uracil(1939)-C(5))-methyltransferase RlmD [Candidatus Woesearchaeota archaeon]